MRDEGDEEDSFSSSGDPLPPDPDSDLRNRTKFNYVLFVAKNIVSDSDKFEFNMLHAYNFSDEELKTAQSILIQDALEASLSLTPGEKGNTGTTQRKSTIVRNIKSILEAVKCN